MCLYWQCLFSCLTSCCWLTLYDLAIMEVTKIRWVTFTLPAGKGGFETFFFRGWAPVSFRSRVLKTFNIDHLRCWQWLCSMECLVLSNSAQDSGLCQAPSHSREPRSITRRVSWHKIQGDFCRLSGREGMPHWHCLVTLASLCYMFWHIMMCCEYAPFCLEDSGRYDCHISF